CAAIERLYQQLACELGPQGIRVICLRSAGAPDSPGEQWAMRVLAERAGVLPEAFEASQAEKTLLKRLPKLAEVAEMAVLMASERARARTGAIANVAWGETWEWGLKWGVGRARHGWRRGLLRNRTDAVPPHSNYVGYTQHGRGGMRCCRLTSEHHGQVALVLLLKGATYLETPKHDEVGKVLLETLARLLPIGKGPFIPSPEGRGLLAPRR